MRNLYMVKIYHHRGNDYSRVILTALSEESARVKALDEWGYQDSRIEYCEFVCTTADEVNKAF